MSDNQSIPVGRRGFWFNCEAKLRDAIMEAKAGLSQADLFRIIEGQDTAIPVDRKKRRKISFLWFLHQLVFLNADEAKELRRRRLEFLETANQTEEA